MKTAPAEERGECGEQIVLSRSPVPNVPGLFVLPALRSGLPLVSEYLPRHLLIPHEGAAEEKQHPRSPPRSGKRGIKPSVFKRRCSEPPTRPLLLIFFFSNSDIFSLDFQSFPASPRRLNTNKRVLTLTRCARAASGSAVVVSHRRLI